MSKLLLILLMTFSVTTGAQNRMDTLTPQETASVERFFTYKLKGGNEVVVLTGNDCKPCKFAKRNMRKVDNRIGNYIRFVYVNVDKVKGLRKALGIRKGLLPIVYLSVDRLPAMMINPYGPPDMLARELSKVLKIPNARIENDRKRETGSTDRQDGITN